MCEEININVNETNENINIISTEIVEVIDINVGETIEEVTFNITEEVIQVNINKVTGGGGEQTLAETLVLGNVTGGENISISNGDAIVLDNGSMLKKGTIDAGNGGSKGIAQICGVGFEHKWEAGRLYIMNDGGTIIREVSHNLTYTPTVTDDVTKGFVQNTRWILDNGDVYLCTDPTEGAAVWEFITGAVPTLPQVLNAGNREVKIWDFSVDGNYTFEAVDKGKFLVFTGGNGYDITIPNGTFDVGDVLLMFDADGGNQIFQDINGLTLTYYGAYYTITCVDVDVFIFSFEVVDYITFLETLGFYREPLILTGGTYVAINNRVYTANGTITITDPTPVTNKGYIVHVIGGTSTIGGVGYTSGALVYRFYNGSSWISTNMNSANGVTSVGLTMPSAFSVTNSPITSSGNIAVSGAGLVSQYIRGDGTLANFPNSTGGGSSVNYYLNGSVSQGTFGGDTYYEMSKTPILGAGTNFTRTNGQGNGYIASFITDAGDPSFLNIPAGNWNLEFYFQSSSTGGSPQFYAEVYKVSATNVFTLVASGSANPEGITNGTTVDQYFTSIPVPQTSLLITDRLAIRIYVITSGRTITLHTENGNLCEILTTFTTGLTALNGLTQQVQNLAVGTSGTDFAISSVTDTHTFNLPTASATNRGALSSTDWSTFNNKQNSSTRRNANNSSNNNINYCGVALGTGVSESSAVWTITRLTIAASGSITTATATNVAWTDRETATYI